MPPSARLTLTILAGCGLLAACSPTSGKSTPSPSTSTSTPPSPSASAGTIPVVSSPGGSAIGQGSSALTIQQAYIDVVKKVRPSVVQIETPSGLGSGIIFDDKGDIVTNAHVVAQSTSFRVTLSDGKRRQASLVGSFPGGDIAVIKTDPAGLTPAGFEDSTRLQVGDIVMAVGNPLGLSSSVTEGIVSATGRTVPEGNGVILPDTIQTSAAINPGNSGGALVDLDAKVVGIPTLAATDPQLGGGAAPGIGFAIPSNTVKDVANQLITTGRVTNSHRAYLGISGATGDQGGVAVARVVAGGPAETAGLQAGDLITAVDGQQVQSIDALNTLLAARKPGDKVSLGVTRSDGSTTSLNVTLGERPTA